jgi:hypothetical protein
VTLGQFLGLDRQDVNVDDVDARRGAATEKAKDFICVCGDAEELQQGVAVLVVAHIQYFEAPFDCTYCASGLVLQDLKA